MKYTVQWSRRALDAVVRYWLPATSTDRREITKATAAIDRLLKNDPNHEGESREPGERILFIDPLIVTVSVDDSNRIVRILNVRRNKRGRQR